ncbi:MAG: NAD(P)H-dependent oxidoreductase subunit E [Spirochaetes bacterium]|nr:NAD(P)H-dependent oxidoreductase subunit E [Spirochaetota bacterium]
MFEKEEAKVKLSTDLKSFIDLWKNKSGNLIMILHRVQQEYGYVPREVALELSKILDVPLAKIYGVVTFYHFFKLTKPGKNQIAVCMGTACYLKGGEDIILEIERLLGLPVNGTTEDGEFSLDAVRCIGCCGLAPVMTINGEVFGKVKKDMLPDIIAKFKGKN